MIVGKLWRALRAQLNKLANFFWTADPIAQMQYEYDLGRRAAQRGPRRAGAVSRTGRAREPAGGHRQAARHDARSQGEELPAGRRPRDGRQVCARVAEGQARSWARTKAQLKMHEEAYNNNVSKIKHATKKLGDVKAKIIKYDAELKMSRAEAEMAKLANSFDFNVTTDFGQIEEVIQDKIGLNRAKARVAADLSSEGLGRHQARGSGGTSDGRPGLARFRSRRWAWSRRKPPTWSEPRRNWDRRPK